MLRFNSMDQIMLNLIVFVVYIFYLEIKNSALPSFQWMNHCGYKGSDLDTKYDVNSLVQCGEACFNRKDCNYFTFASPMTCALKKISNLQSPVPTQGSICGMFPNRIPNSASICQWQTSEDGLYQWADDCKISGVMGSSITINSRPSVLANNRTACAEICKANTKCNYFFFQPNQYGSHCFLHYLPGLTPDLKYVGPRRTVGMITARKFSVEFLPNKQQHQCSKMARNIPLSSKNRIDPIADSSENDDQWFWLD